LLNKRNCYTQTLGEFRHFAMTQKISQRLLEIVNALPLKEGIKILEIGCGTGVAAPEIANRFGDIYVLAIDRSSKAIEQAKVNSKAEIKSGKLNFIQSKVEEFELQEPEELFDLESAARVGALDGRHPEIEKESLKRIVKILKEQCKIFIEGGNPLKEIKL
jgi:2-polyprenyl-3-methyl-5-hydroxy-6-metoxy-1,4-benzoquinol methylase